MPDERINILISTNSAYFDPALAMLYSLFSCHDNISMDIYLPYSNLKKEEIQELQAFISLFRNKTLHLIRIDADFSNRVVSHHGISIETYYRILAIDLLPKTLDRILYLDVDMIIQGSLKELYETDIKGYPFVVCEDILGILNGFHESNKYRLGIPKEYSYFNAGVMLFNLEYLRETGACAMLLDRIYRNYERYEYNDQDVLNECYFDKLLWAGWDRYNLPPALYYLDKKALEEKRVSFADYAQLRQQSEADPKGVSAQYQDLSYAMRDGAKIIHYMGAAKPWNRDLTQHDAVVYRYYDEPYNRNAFLAGNRKGSYGRWFHENKGQVLRELLGVGYSYYYLKNRMKKSMKKNTALIFGSSYGVQGIRDAGRDRISNLSAPSQDLFCDNGLSERILQQSEEVLSSDNNRICVLILGYYALYDDLSRAGEKISQLMNTTYEPLIGSCHHHQREHFDLHKELCNHFPQMDEGKIRECEEWIDRFFEENDYFNAIYTREGNDPDYQGEWANLPTEEKRQIGEKRAQLHNRLIRHKDVRDENVEILGTMLERLQKKGVPTVVVIPPFTVYYRDHLTPDYQTELLEVLDQLPVPVEYLDFNQSELFDDSDFFDSDHLNDKGAGKFTNCLLQILGMPEA